MNFEDYDQYIAAKHRLAVALAVIITKPDNETIEEYINRIKNEVIAEEMATNVDVSLNDNDFDISDDMDNDDHIDSSQGSVSILKNFDENQLGNVRADAISLLDVMTQLSHIDEISVNQISKTNTQNNITQSTFCDESQNQNDDSMTILPDPEGITMSCKSFSKRSNIEKDVSQNTYLFTSNETFCETNTENDINEAINNVNNEIDAHNSIIDTQQTVIYTLQGFTNNTHISQSQEDLVMIQKDLLNKHVCPTNSAYNEENSLKIIESSNCSFDNKNKKLEIMYIEQDFGAKTLNKDSLSGKTKKTKKVTDGRYSKTKSGKSYKNNKRKSYVSPDLKTQIINNASTSEFSQIAFRKTADEYLSVFGINNKFDDNNKNISVQQNSLLNNDLNHQMPYESQDAQSYNILSDNIDTYRHNSIRSTQTSEIRFTREESLNHSLKYQNEYIKHITPTKYDSNASIKKSTKELNNKQNNFFDDSINFDDTTTNLIKSNKDNENKIVFDSNCVELTQSELNLSLNNLKNLDPLIDKKDFRSVEHESKKKEYVSCYTEMETEDIDIDLTKDETTESIPNQSASKEYLSNDNRMLDEDVFSDNATESQAEIVSFKTLEELNKIKCYLSKRERHFNEGNSGDSGFKSSQPRSSYNSASQYSEGWINESAHSLLIYLKTCQPSRRATDITDEISKILGKLVDKLHDQEIYPKFLEELLETVDLLLKDVYDGKNEEFNKLIKKDETIYHLLLLNRSTHIIKYTVEKIVNILENILSELTDIEITNTDRSENICYIFHVLEIILQRIKITSSQSLQSSQQEEKVLKMSSLTEIWRRKWNLSKSVHEGSLKKKCVLTKCSEILNKVIVQAMDGYSLVSFAALQCFNLLQN